MTDKQESGMRITRGQLEFSPHSKSSTPGPRAFSSAKRRITSAIPAGALSLSEAEEHHVTQLH
jgi:hypothetical protein